MIVLDGALNGAQRSDPVMTAVRELFAQRGWSAEMETLRDKNISACTACDACWYKMPGICAILDAGREIAGKVIRSDAVVLLSPVTFGGYSSTLKKAIDRTRPLLSPLLRSAGGKLGHVPRYDRYPKIIAIGTLPEPDAESERLFHDLVRRNSYLLHAPAYASVIVYDDQGPEEIRKQINELLTEAGI
ncbi:MAG TPA: flavodoxin family protein [Methanocella sp.]|nr:flavodoxin family protein [Methanocella sp.]